MVDRVSPGNATGMPTLSGRSESLEPVPLLLLTFPSSRAVTGIPLASW